ncbi:MAG TPA: cation:proton antiporter, partial [Persephonella sp.]|nr:cation:proton antiporter [Persephonella sp.]
MEIHIVFLMLFLIFFVARTLAEIFNYFKIPPVLGEITAGIILGPSLLGLIEPNELLRILAEIGIVLLLF